MVRETLDTIKLRKNFYRNNYYRVLRGLYVSLFVIIILILAVFYAMITQPTTQFYATNSVGFVHPLPALDRPNDSPNYLLKPDPPQLGPGEPKDIRFEDVDTGNNNGGGST